MEISNTLQGLISIIDESAKALKKQISQLKKVESDVKRLENQYRKLDEKCKKKQSSAKKVSGFAKPVNISTQLSEFIEKNMREILDVEIKDAEDDSEKVREANEKRRLENIYLAQLIEDFSKKDPQEPFVKMARTSVTKLLTRYIKYHELQNPEKRTNIIITSPKGKLLGALLKGVDTSTNPDDLTFIGMQKYITHHFNPEVPAPSIKKKVVRRVAPPRVRRTAKA